MVRRADTATTSPARKSQARVAVEQMSAAADTLHENRSPASTATSSAAIATAHPAAAAIDRIGAQLESRAGHAATGGSPALHLVLELAALLREIDAQQLRTELRQNPSGADHADQISDGKGDRDVVGHGRTLGLGRIEVRDRVHGRADGRGLGRAPGDEPGRRARVVAEGERNDIGNDEPDGGHDRGERRVRKPSLRSPRKNCGPVRKPIANRNSRKKHCLTSSGSVMPSWPTSTPASRVPVTAPSLNPPSEIFPEQIAEAENRRRMRSRDARSAGTSHPAVMVTGSARATVGESGSKLPPSARYRLTRCTRRSVCTRTSAERDPCTATCCCCTARRSPEPTR